MNTVKTPCHSERQGAGGVRSSTWGNSLLLMLSYPEVVVTMGPSTSDHPPPPASWANKLRTSWARKPLWARKRLDNMSYLCHHRFIIYLELIGAGIQRLSIDDLFQPMSLMSSSSSWFLCFLGTKWKGSSPPYLFEKHLSLTPSLSHLSDIWGKKQSHERWQLAKIILSCPPPHHETKSIKHTNCSPSHLKVIKKLLSKGKSFRKGDMIPQIVKISRSLYKSSLEKHFSWHAECPFLFRTSKETQTSI